METQPGDGIMKEEKFPNTRKPSPWRVCGEFWNLRGKYNREKKKKKESPQNKRLTTSTSEVAQMLTSAISKRGLNSWMRVARLG